MAVYISASNGQTWYTDGDDVAAVKSAIDTGQPLPCWFFTTYGQRVRETIWFPPDSIEMIRTESDD